MIAMVSLGQGAQQQVQQQIASMGTNMLIVHAGQPEQRRLARRRRAPARRSRPDDVAGDSARRARGARRESERRRFGDAGVRQPELDHARRRRGYVAIPRSAIAASSSGEFFSGCRCDERGASGGDRPDRGEPACSRHGPGRTDDARAQPAVPRGGRARGQRAEPVRPGPGRHAADAVHDGDEEAALRPTTFSTAFMFRAASDADHGARSSRSATSCARGTTSATGSRTTSRCATSPTWRDSGRGDHARDDVAAGRHRRRSRCWWAASGS